MSAAGEIEPSRMDTLTHAISGALLARLVCVRPATAPMPHEVAQVLEPRGRFAAAWDHAPGHLAPWQAMVVGAVAAAFPDIDAVTAWGGDFFYLRHHRGVTHSVLLAPLWALALAWLMARWFEITRERPGGWKAIYLLALGGIWLHIAGDWITTFGTMMLAPFSDRRFGLGAMFIIDLVFTGLLLAGLVLAAWRPRQRWPAALGLAAAAAWVGVAWVGKQEAEAFAQQHARAQGLRVEAIESMPRPASPFNWTLAIFDGRDYHLAHVNTRRSEPLVAQPGDSFIRRLSAPYRPLAAAEWTRLPRFGGDAAPVWVLDAWGHEAFATYRWFAQVPVFLKAAQRVLPAAQTGGGGSGGGGGSAGTRSAGVGSEGAVGDTERCAAFRDLRFEFPGRENSPFRFALCLRDGPDARDGGSAARVIRLDGDAWPAE